MVGGHHRKKPLVSFVRLSALGPCPRRFTLMALALTPPTLNCGVLPGQLSGAPQTVGFGVVAWSRARNPSLGLSSLR